eukprot:7156739-Ditylum_brightwellii.AAC.1
MILQGTEAPTYEPQNHEHAKSPMAYSGHTDIQCTLAISLDLTISHILADGQNQVTIGHILADGHPCRSVPEAL